MMSSSRTAGRWGRDGSQCDRQAAAAAQRRQEKLLGWTSPGTPRKEALAKPDWALLVGGGETAVSPRIPSASWGKISTVVVNAPEASVVTGAAVVPAMPWFHPSWTATPGGNCTPCATTRVPGGPTAGVSTSPG